jgi:hypothetical protein
MTREEALTAAKELAAAPASQWVGTGVLPDGRAAVHKCLRCGAEEFLELPKDPSKVPGHDARVFAWARAFLIKHEGCVEAQAKAEAKK